MDGEMLSCTNAVRIVDNMLPVVMNKHWIKAKMTAYKTVLLSTLLFETNSWVCQVRHKSKRNAIGIGHSGASMGMGQGGINSNVTFFLIWKAYNLTQPFSKQKMIFFLHL